MTIITNGAYFRARIFHIAYQKAAEELNIHGIEDWETLPPDDKLHLASAFQKMIDLNLMEPLSLRQVSTLRLHGWVQPRASEVERTE